MKHRRCQCCSWGRFILSAFFAWTQFMGAREAVIEFWAWEKTPIPMGFPTWTQYAEGVWMVIRAMR